MHTQCQTPVSDWLFPFDRATITIIMCLIDWAYVSLATSRPLCVHSVFQTDNVLWKLCVLDAVTIRRLRAGHIAMHTHTALEWFEACFIDYYGHVCFWILRSMIMICSENSHLLLPFHYWLIGKKSARLRSLFFTFKHWIPQTVTCFLCCR